MSTSTSPAAAGSNKPFVASESLAAFFDGLRATGTTLKISNARLARMLQSALLDLDTEADADLAEDAATLEADLDVIAEALEFAEREAGAAS